MVTPITTPALVLSRERRGDTSLTLMLFSRDLGRLRCTARAALVPRSRTGTPPDLLQTVEVVLRPAPSGRTFYLNHASLLHDPAGIRTSYARLALGCYFASLVELCLDDRHPAPDVHDLMSAALLWLETHDASVAALHRFEHRLLGCLGLGADHIAPSSARFSQVFLQNFGRLPANRAALLRQLTGPDSRTTDTV